MSRRYYLPRKQLKVYVTEDLDSKVRKELSRNQMRGKPAHGDMSKLVTILLKKWLATQQSPHKDEIPFLVDAE